MTDQSFYEQLLQDEGLTHDEVIEALDDLVQSGQMERNVHRVLLAALEVAGE